VSWLDPDFGYPARLKLASGHHIRPIRESDVDLDYPAVMGSRERLWEKYGGTWGWPPPTMSFEADREDLARHAAEAEAREGYNYAAFDPEETQLLGCVYIDPPQPGAPLDADASVSWWVVDAAVGTTLERALDEAMPAWLTDVWGFEAVHYHP
jgi:RimJ/RimL family protein N-acetyltransferase